MRKGKTKLVGCCQTPPKLKESIHSSFSRYRTQNRVVLMKMQHYDEGYMTVEQVNLLFKTLPIDLTYVR